MMIVLTYVFRIITVSAQKVDIFFNIRVVFVRFIVGFAFQ